MPADGFDCGKSAFDFNHVTTLRVKTAFSPANTVPRSRSGENVSVCNARRQWPHFLLKLWPALPIGDKDLSKNQPQSHPKINQKTIVL
jgi:hypothetical protein